MVLAQFTCQLCLCFNIVSTGHAWLLIYLSKIFLILTVVVTDAIILLIIMASLQNAGIHYTDCLSMFFVNFFSVFTLLLITWEVHSSLRRIFPNVRMIAFTLLIGFGYSQKTKLWCLHWLNSCILIMLQKWSVWKSLMQELSWHMCHLITMHLQARRRYIF